MQLTISSLQLHTASHNQHLAANMPSRPISTPFANNRFAALQVALQRADSDFKTAKAGLDAAVKRGDEILAKFEAANKNNK